MRFVVAGGGTGGHIYPALAIARGLKARYPGAEILYIGTAGGMEADIVPREGLPFKGIVASGLKRKLSLSNLAVLWQAGYGFCQAYRTIRRLRPAAVIGTGGYVCGPVLLAAALSKIPTLIHEQNALPGITNRILARFVDRITITFAASVDYFTPRKKVRLTGLPVRPEILQVEKSCHPGKSGIEGGRLSLLSFGGSRGARTINMAMVEVIKKFAGDPRVDIFHVTGKAGYNEFVENCAARGIDMGNYGNITVKSYIYHMQDVLAAADLVLSRAGAATLAELTAVGIPAILVPYPYASENHQEFNARALEKEGAAMVVPDQKLNGKLLCRELEALLSGRDRLSEMAAASKKMGKRNALADIIDCVAELVGY